MKTRNTTPKFALKYKEGRQKTSKLAEICLQLSEILKDQNSRIFESKWELNRHFDKIDRYHFNVD